MWTDWGAFVCSYLQFLRVPVRRVLDVGCGIGLWRDLIARHYPPRAVPRRGSTANTCARALAGSVARWWTTGQRPRLTLVHLPGCAALSV
jgi:hypothetical protein